MKLVRYDAMCRAIDAAYQVDEVKDIRDRAIALEHYARQARNVDAERRACEVRLRAERKAGAPRRQEEKAKGARPFTKNNSPPSGGKISTNAMRRHQLGISKKQDEQWQALAAVPDDLYEQHLANLTQAPTTAGIIRAAAAPKVNPVSERHAMGMTPVKARIVELVRRAGVDGIAGDDLFAIVYDGQLPRYRGGHTGRNETRSRKALKANVWQINQQLDGFRIVTSRCRGGRYWWQKV